MAHTLILYAQDNDDRLPNADNWTGAANQYMDEARGNLRGAFNPFHCPSDRRGNSEISYAMNASLSGKKLSELPPNTVLIFESDLPGPSPNGSEEDVAPPRHRTPSGKGNWYVFTDMSTKYLEKPPIFNPSPNE